jgi:hypothetical protein
MKMITFWDLAPCSLVEVYRALIREAVRTSGTSVYFNETTRRFIQFFPFLLVLNTFL